MDSFDKWTKQTMFFEENIGQKNEPIKFFIDNFDYRAYFMNNALQLVIGSYFTEIVSMEMQNVNSFVEIVGEEKLPGKVHYLNGKENDWIQDVRIFGSIRYNNLYNGIDMLVYINNDKIEEDFIVRPGGNPEDIKIKLTGCNKVKISNTGDLNIQTNYRTIILRAPIVYQMVENEKYFISGKFIKKHNLVSFQIGDYEKDKDLIIDPIIDFSIVVDEKNNSSIDKVISDEEENVYALITHTNGYLEVQKYTKLGYLEYSIKNLGYLNSIGSSFVFDEDGNLLIVGMNTLESETESFIIKLDGEGKKIKFLTDIHNANKPLQQLEKPRKSDFLNTFLDKTNIFTIVKDIAIDYTGDMVVTGITNCYQYPNVNAFVYKYSKDGTNKLFEINILSDADSVGIHLEVDRMGNIFVIGNVDITNKVLNFPITENAYQKFPSGNNICGWVCKINSNGEIMELTYLGGDIEDTILRDAMINSTGEIYIIGSTKGGFPVTNQAYKKSFEYGMQNGFVCRMSNDLKKLVYSSYLVNEHNAIAKSMGKDECENIYITGVCSNTNVFISKYNKELSHLLYSSYFGTSKDKSKVKLAVVKPDTLYISGNDIMQTSLNRIHTIDNLDTVYIPDDNFRKALNAYLGRGRVTDSIRVKDIVKFPRELDLANQKIENLTGIEVFKHVLSLNLKNNMIQNIEPLSDLIQLQYLDLSFNCIKNVDLILKKLETLRYLDISYNYINQLELLPSLKCLNTLICRQNQISKIKGVKDLSCLRMYDFNAQGITLKPLDMKKDSVEIDISFLLDVEEKQPYIFNISHNGKFRKGKVVWHKVNDTSMLTLDFKSNHFTGKVFQPLFFVKN